MDSRAGTITIAGQPFTITQGGLAPPGVSFAPSSLTNSAPVGQNHSNQNFEIWNGGGGTLNYTIGVDQSWLSVNPAGGGSTGERDAIQVTYATAGLLAGSYHATITISAAGAANSPQVLPVTLIVSPSIPSRLTGTLFTNGVCQFMLHGVAGEVFTIEASSNLVNWLPLSTHTIPAGGSVPIIDPTAINQPRRFYRAVPGAPPAIINLPAASGVVTAPFIIANGAIYQPIQTLDLSGGRAVYNFSITSAGNYVVRGTVNAPHGATNSFFVNIDAEPKAPYTLWNIDPLTSGFEERTVSWAGNGTSTSQFVPKVFNLAAGQHQLIIRGREAYTLLQSSAIVPIDYAPTVSAISQNPGDVDPAVPGVQVNSGMTVQYSCSASDPQGASLNWQWIYSMNGGPEVVAQSGSGAVSPANFTYGTSAGGNTYVWTLRVSNSQAITESQLSVGVTPPVVPPQGLTIPAAQGAISVPFVLNNGSIYQPSTTTSPLSGGRAAYNFSIVTAGDYVIRGIVNAPNTATNSFFVNIDAEPQQDNFMVWNIDPFTSGFELRTVSWVGNGTTNSQFVPKIFPLTNGQHQLIIRGREAGTSLQSVTIAPYP